MNSSGRTYRPKNNSEDHYLIFERLFIPSYPKYKTTFEFGLTYKTFIHFVSNIYPFFQSNPIYSLILQVNHSYHNMRPFLIFSLMVFSE